ncbi:toxic anion resistance protein [Kribbia dieselivorans]|uniref:toxic anion resistance protein n=1 Tax=Kribbia dieselivorans TaxID=331526 RepID=UPI0008399EC7|nr:toxic anion resistance protein [Kribbia dieselivorans]
MTDQPQTSGSPLDLNAPAAPVAAAPPAPEATTDLVLTPPSAVPVVQPQQATTMMPLDPATAQALQSKADAYVQSLANLDPRAPEFATKIRDVTHMGDQDVRAASQVANRMLERPVKALEAAKGHGGNQPQEKVADGLVELRRTIEDLDPSQVDKPGIGRMLSKLPWGNSVRDYFGKYASAQTHLDKIINSLQNGQEELRKDNAAIEGEKANLWATMQRLQEYAVLTEALDNSLERHIDQVSLTDQTKADQLKSDMLFAVRQKHQDLLTQLAVSAQGYLALDMIRKNNNELVRGVERATTTTVSALRTAVVVAQALANQKLVLDQITALNTTTSNLIVSTSEMLKQQTGQIHEQAASSMVSIDALKQSFANVYATMDAIDTFKIQAVDNMAQTVTTLQTELGKANEYLERAQKQQEIADTQFRPGR